MRGVTPVLAALRGRMPSLPRNEALPLGLLLLALASVFAFGGERSQFYRPGLHSAVSAQTLTIAGNLSAEHRFLGFRNRSLDRQDEPAYYLYNRFPIGSYALIKIAALPAGDDIPGQILAAGLLMLAFFAAAAVLAYLALARLLGDRRIALAATLLAFSPYYLLHYNDMISAETSTNLFGVMLVFHGMALFAQEGRFRQLLAKTAVAILLGWHVLALIAPFVLLALGRELLASRADGGGARPKVERRLRPRAILAYGAFSALCAALVLGFNFGNEYRALGGEVPLHELPSFRSMLSRGGVDASQHWVSLFGWETFLRGQFGGIGGMAIPYAVADRLGLDLAQYGNRFWPAAPVAPGLAVLGAAAVFACAAGLRQLPQRTLFATLLLAGPCWAIPFRGSFPHHEFEAMFLVGFPLVLYALALLGLRRLIGLRRAAWALPAAAIAAAAVFALSAHDMGRIGHGAEAAALQRDVAADVEAIRELAAGRSVVVRAGDDVWALRFEVGGEWYQVEPVSSYYLAGSYIQHDAVGSARDWDRAAARFDYVIAPLDLGGSLTPGNRRLHLYPFGALPAARARIAAREPALRAEYDLRVEGRTLTLLREPCGPDHTQAGFFVEAVPSGARSGERREFAFGQYGVRFGDTCIARFELPDGPLAGLRAGQQWDGLPPVWEASLPLGDASFPRGVSTWRDGAAASESAASSAFGVNRNGRTLTWVREDCAPEDTEDRFFVHVYDFGGARENLDFWFGERGARWGGACVAAVELPDYEVRSVRTGQYDETGHLWDEEFALDAGAWLARFEAAAAREPTLRAGGFGLRVDGRALTFVREACSAADIEDRFFVHAYAADGGGRENLDFWFRERGLRHGDRCMATVALPEYAIAHVVAGQYTGDGAIWEAELALGGASR